ncbi:preprotein translocase subunit YajC [Aquibacillus sp. 3ASR75-11]|uniref:Preprotein translocase subunit YajC n=1 Tax=Terrihalobacillus insolitus TaxID=2950438 RepID=A0A9X3WV37_9BACI|nr:preprotein translocase subunit YajC [Terrihalobacillus insolitus]MDC3412439.1 preprotein translocase subunit YajC [Terrihalobacillus insolitus]MDC3423859.1 preprotein translocase subunit YajC [Terrihalobacillus insolitus]
MDLLVQLSPIILMFVIFYFLLIRPQQKKQKKVREMQSDLKKGDKIVTIGGLHGTVHAVNEGNIVLTVEDGTKLTYDRSAVREVVNQD